MVSKTVVTSSLRELVGKLEDGHARFESSTETADFTARINNQQTYGGVFFAGPAPTVAGS